MFDGAGGGVWKGKCMRAWECVSKGSLKYLLTAFHLQQGFGQDAACHTDGLADVVPRILAVHICNGQLST